MVKTRHKVKDTPKGTKKKKKNTPTAAKEFLLSLARSKTAY
jgi:hypothetical protein